MSRLSGRGFDSEGLLAGTRRHDMEAFGAAFTRPKRLLALAAASLLPAALLARLMGGRSDPDDTATVLFSSGSEGTPKGIELSHRNVLANARQVTEAIDVQPRDVVLGNLPLFHAFGLTVTTFLPAIEGVPVAAHPDATDALGNARTIAHQGATVMCSTSSFLRLFVRNTRVHPAMLDSIRYVVAGAERLDPGVRDLFEQRFLKRVHEGYGTTETAPVVAANIPDHFNRQHRSVQPGHRQGTVGRPMPGTACRIVDPDTNAPLGVNADGLVLVAGPQVMTGYLAEPERTAEAVVELDGHRWYRTGDMGRMDGDGFITIVDRYSRFAKISGEMISLTRVEAAVRDVMPSGEADIAAVNLPDARKGERIVLLVAMDADTETIQRAISDSDIHALMKPAAVHAVAALPRLGTGKLDFKGAKALARQREAAEAA
jgi:acyl-[acyl-carrier-protein]-phospholipid O-acyltransferase/long-chain-fatty-acid--[acyl-carrier-protein] ligase